MLHDKYLFPKAEADSLSSFLTPMLRLNPEKRAKAGEMVHHRWLDDVVVQGEIDVLRKMEQDEEKKRHQQEAAVAEATPLPTSEAVAVAAAATSKERERASALAKALAQSEMDAMKPVDEDLVAGSPPQTRPLV